MTKMILPKVFSAILSATVIWLSVSVNLAYALPQLNGIAVHKELGQEQFIAAVFVDTPTSNTREILLSDQDKAMEVRVLASRIYARRFNRMWIEGLAINSGANELKKHAENLAEFSNFMRVKLRKGDILRMERDKKSGTAAYLNGIKLGSIKDPQFFDLLLRTWVGPVPLSTDFKAALLSAGNVDTSLFQRFSDIHPEEARIAAISNALKGVTTPPSPTAQPPVQTQQSSSVESTPAVVQVSSSSSSSTPEVVPSSKSSSSKPPVVVSSSSKQQSIAAVQPEGIVGEDDLFADESIFDDEEETFSFTAESLLSEQLYISKLTKWTGNYIKYPKFAIRNNQQGTVRLTVTLARNGKVQDIQYLEKSNYEQLNRAAYKAVKNASPFPAVPDEIAGDNFVFTVPVVFRLQ